MKHVSWPVSPPLLAHGNSLERGTLSAKKDFPNIFTKATSYQWHTAVLAILEKSKATTLSPSSLPQRHRCCTPQWKPYTLKVPHASACLLGATQNPKQSGIIADKHKTSHPTVEVCDRTPPQLFSHHPQSRHPSLKQNDLTQTELSLQPSQ